MAKDLWTGRRTVRDWSLGAVSVPPAELVERRISAHEQAPRSALERIPYAYLYAPSHNPLLLERSTLTAFGKMLQAARAAGIPSPLLKIVSGFRTFATQELLWQKALGKYLKPDGSPDPETARIYVAPPGHSTHATGRAVDLWLGMACDSRNVEAGRRTKAYAWLANNARKFGFYPYLHEPWHWVFAPTEKEAAEAEIPMPTTGKEIRGIEEKSTGWTSLIIGALLLTGAGGAAWYTTSKRRPTT
jgi:LAS superfamily LD-carboxypeptidase LdcB